MWMVIPKWLFTCALKYVHWNIILCNVLLHVEDMACECVLEMGSIFGLLLSENVIPNVILALATLSDFLAFMWCFQTKKHAIVIDFKGSSYWCNKIGDRSAADRKKVEDSCRVWCMPWSLGARRVGGAWVSYFLTFIFYYFYEINLWFMVLKKLRKYLSIYLFWNFDGKIRRKLRKIMEKIDIDIPLNEYDV